ncbi:hypothetical protein E1264_11765 [Actinomadura sp. KC216]|uniref:hypothetical protein n=1 Tax=Actinomadura sp. KC216 TaxID=2530370 RepID=UPI0010469351|nr:hypothetical protein [Actinomadura sp. KC216]TDB88352.1 hypothetical protein E1264_11765 [Actinomadura sp. KC216]
MSISTVPAVIDELVRRTRLVLPEVQVLDGGPHRDTEPDVICIGFQIPPGAPSVEDTRTRQQLATSPDREQYEITSLASSWRGEQHDAKAVRDRVYEMIDALAAELERDQRLGGLVNRARLSTGALAQEQTSKGATATVRFVISVDAFTR